MVRVSKAALLLALAAMLLAVQTALAHSFVDHCTPDSGATLQQPPTQLTCTFTEAIDVKQTKFSVVDEKANTVDNGDLKADPNDNKGVSVILTLNLARMTGGVYTVRWSTVSEDGDPTDGQFQFSVNAQPVPSIAIVSPTEDTPFGSDPSDVPVTVKVSNFALGQSGRRWQVYLNGDLAAQVTDGSTTTTLKGVKKGDYGMKVTLATDDKTIVATAGLHLSVAPDTTPTTQPSTTQPSTTQPTATQPATLPKTGAAPSPGGTLAVLLAAGGLLLLGTSLWLRKNR
jgi:methionine-rich copper-binding protein CopC